jgi:hypothetical protein
MTHPQALQQPWTFHVRSDIVVIGQNPEMADVDNPQGHQHGLLWYVQGYDTYGNTRELAVLSSNDPEAAAHTLAARLNTRMVKLGKPPVGFALWPQGRPIYGSEAYVDYGQAADLALERQEDDEARNGGYF